MHAESNRLSLGLVVRHSDTVNPPGYYNLRDLETHWTIFKRIGRADLSPDYPMCIQGGTVNIPLNPSYTTLLALRLELKTEQNRLGPFLVLLASTVCRNSCPEYTSYGIFAPTGCAWRAQKAIVVMRKAYIMGYIA
jgi:hypothetical protein